MSTPWSFPLQALRTRLHGWVFSRTLPALPLIAALVLPLAGFAILMKWPGSDLALGSPTSHFIIVTVVTALTLGLSIAVIWAARSLPDPRTFFLAMGFLSLSTIFLAHGLGTSPLYGSHADIDPFAAYGGGHSAAPAVAGAAPFDSTFGLLNRLAGENGARTVEPPAHHPAPTPAEDKDTATALARLRVVGYSAQLSLFASAIFFALATISFGQRMQNLIVRYWKAGLVALCTPLAGHVYLALERPTLISGIPIDSNPLKWITASIAVRGFIFAGVRFFQSYRLAQLPVQGALAFGMAFLVETQIFMSAGRGWHLSWWEYHLPCWSASSFASSSCFGNTE